MTNNRLEILKSYLDEAMKDPDSNKLYIEDLEFSIKYENQARKIRTGFELTKQE